MTRSGTFRSHPARAAFLAAGLLLISSLGQPALAQLGLDREVVAASAITADGEAKIVAHIDRNKAGLTKDAESITAARRQLLQPLREASVSSAFRLKYADLLVPVLGPMLSGANTDAAINAARVLGEIGAQKAADTLVPALQDARPPVRLVAAQALRATYETAMQGRETALGGSKATSLLNSIDSAFRAESDPAVADALISAMDAAAGVSSIPNLRSAAIEAMGAAIQAKAKDPKSAMFATAFARAAKSMFDLVKDPAIGQSLTQESKKAAGGLAGDLLAHALRRRTAGKLDAAECADLQTIVRLAENVYLYAHKALGGNATGKKLDESLCAENDNFRRDVLQLIGGEGVLTKAPFGFPAERFK